MPLLTDFDWRIKYDPDEGTLIEQFYLTALACAQRYDRTCLLYTSPSPRDRTRSRMPSSA